VDKCKKKRRRRRRKDGKLGNISKPDFTFPLTVVIRFSDLNLSYNMG